MQKKKFFSPFILLILTGFILSLGQSNIFAEQTSETQKPNFIVVLCDDLGYGDLACYGHPVIKTPNIDHFAKQGIRLTNCYAAAPNCSPSRTGLMTGRTPYRVGVHNWIPYDSPMHVRKN